MSPPTSRSAAPTMCVLLLVLLASVTTAAPVRGQSESGVVPGVRIGSGAFVAGLGHIGPSFDGATMSTRPSFERTRLADAIAMSNERVRGSVGSHLMAGATFGALIGAGAGLAIDQQQDQIDGSSRAVESFYYTRNGAIIGAAVGALSGAVVHLLGSE